MASARGLALALLVSVLLADAAPAPTVRLSNGVEMPVVALGVWQFSDAEAAAAVSAALGVGYAHIDTAYDYNNQRGVSVGLQKSGKPREEVFVTTKVPGCGLGGVSSDRCYDDTLKFVEEDLLELSLAYPMGQLDLVLIHFPPCTEASGQPSTSPLATKCFKEKNGCSTPEHCIAIQKQWAAMEKAYAMNITRAIGVSNYCSACFQCLAKTATIMPMVNQVQLHVGMGRDPQGFRSFSRQMDVVLQAWSPLGHGGHGSGDILDGNLTKAIGKSHGKSPAQVALKWLLTHGVSVATKSANPAHLRENLALFDFELTADEMAHLDAADFAKADTPSFLCEDHKATPTAFV